MRFESGFFEKLRASEAKKRVRWKKMRSFLGYYIKMSASVAEVRENFLHTKICCSTVNMKYNVRVFLPESAKGTSEVTQNAQFILRGLIQVYHSS